MICRDKQGNQSCNENPADCCFELRFFKAGAVIHKEDLETHSLIFCHTGHLKISCTLFHNEMLCAGEIIFLPRHSDCSGIALSDTTLLIHRFNNTVCRIENCILSFLFTHKHIETQENKTYLYSKLTACGQLTHLMDGINGYLGDATYDPTLWRLKHKELIWLFTKYYSSEELQLFFHPMTDEEIPFKSLVLAHYRKAEYTDRLAEMCGYQLHTFRRKFKEEFGVSTHRWLTIKRAEIVRHRLSLDYIPFSDILAEFRFSSPQQFNRFCKDNLGDSPLNLRRKYTEGVNKTNLSKNDN